LNRLLRESSFFARSEAGASAKPTTGSPAKRRTKANDLGKRFKRRYLLGTTRRTL